MDRLCDKSNLRFKFSTPDYLEVLKSDDADVASLKVDTGTAFSDFRKWCEESDTATIFMIPERVADFSNHTQVISATSFTDLLLNHQSISLDDVTGYQEFINTAADTVEIDSSNMVSRVLSNATEKSLLLRVKQSYDVLPPAQQGGLVFFKLVADAIDKDTFENRQALIDWMKSFTILSYDGENVDVASTRFSAIATSLGAHGPPDAARYYMEGMAKSSCEKFNGSVNAAIGLHGNHLYKQLLTTKKSGSNLSELQDLIQSFSARYLSLRQTNEWTGVNHKASKSSNSAFKAQFSNRKEFDFKAWFDSKICGTCGKNHPTKYHNDLGARDRERPTRPSSRNGRDNGRSFSGDRSASRDRGFPRNRGSSQERKGNRIPKFKSPQSQQSFRRAVHQAAIEHVDQSDLELFAHLAGNDSGDDSPPKTISTVPTTATTMRCY